MNSRKYNTNPAILLKQGKAIMSSSDESKFHFRVFAVNMVLSGCPTSQIGEMAGVSKAAVTGWVKTADEQGFDALKTKQRPGRPRKLSGEQLSDIDAALQADPKGYGFKVWDGPSLSAYINDKYGIDLGVRQCRRLFHDLGYSHIRPQPYPGKGYEDTEEREAFKKTLRDRSGRQPDPCISGRSPLSNTNNRNGWLAQTRKCSNGEAISGSVQNIPQQLCHSSDRRTVCLQA